MNVFPKWSLIEKLQPERIMFWGVQVTTGELLLLAVAVGLSLAFEFVNGFHDTANAVATVIYTKTLKPTYAVVWSGLWNLIGALWSSGTVAYSIIALLPAALVLQAGSGAGLAMVFAILLSAIIWNVGTWYLGLPASSSHTMIGAILGVGIGFAVWNGKPWTDGLNIPKVESVGLALLVSPLVGFGGAAILLLILKAICPFEELFKAPTGETPPPWWIRLILMGTCTGVSFSHGSNDAQKGMGLMMLILFGIVPGAFALDMNLSQSDIQELTAKIQAAEAVFESKAAGTTVDPGAVAPTLKGIKKDGTADATAFAALGLESKGIVSQIATIKSFEDLTPDNRISLRKDLYALNGAVVNLLAEKATLAAGNEKDTVQHLAEDLKKKTEFLPWWVKTMVAIALGLGTMIGWKRIVVTVGEKIGKSHLTYAQGASAEFTAMCTVFAADTFNAPVSTTHVLSSGIAGTMAANRSGLQTQTLINILLAWVLTLPICIFLGAGLFSSALYVIFHVFGG